MTRPIRPVLLAEARQVDRTTEIGTVYPSGLRTFDGEVAIPGFVVVVRDAGDDPKRYLGPSLALVVAADRPTLRSGLRNERGVVVVPGPVRVVAGGARG